MYGRQGGFSFQLPIADVATITSTPVTVESILKANAAYATALGPYSQSGDRPNDVGVACSLQVIAASADDIWFVETLGLTPGAAAGNEIIRGAGLFFFTNARVVKIASKGGSATVRIHYYLPDGC